MTLAKGDELLTCSWCNAELGTVHQGESSYCGDCREHMALGLTPARTEAEKTSPRRLARMERVKVVG